ncbi:membrane protein [Streptomyces albiflavescens]|uniref:Membrane protein n=1 Tax=Streptomyces albiflavescens TaxID=1623582 RepID=A0A917XXY4_9ACTN|nr:ABC transporter permease [Streptomyces albiflavescens]GGN58814.1 membrane protein [Streptomyces albiflavescens]
MHHATTYPPGAPSGLAPQDPNADPAADHGRRARHALVDSEPDLPAPVLAAAAGARKAILVPVITALAIGTVFVAVYLAAFHAPSARHQPVGIAASDRVAAHTELALNNAAPDGYTFYRYPDAEAARQAVTHDEVPAALVADGQGTRVLVAGAQGPSTVSSLATAMTAAVGKPVPVKDVLPLAAGDSRGLSVFYAAFGVVLAGFLFAVSSYQIAPRLRLAVRVASMLVFSAASGVVVALLTHTAFSALPASFAVVTVVVGLLAWASAAAAGLLLRLFGPLGMPVASVVLLILGNATSGGILPATFLPAWLSPLASVMPPAAAVRGLRGAAYFHDVHLTGAIVTLAAWGLGCLTVQYVLDRVAAGRAQTGVPATVAAR